MIQEVTKPIGQQLTMALSILGTFLISVIILYAFL